MFIIASLWKDWYGNMPSLALDLSLIKVGELLPESVTLFGPYVPHLQNEELKPDQCFQKRRDNRWHKFEKVLTSYVFILTCAWKTFN